MPAAGAKNSASFCNACRIGPACSAGAAVSALSVFTLASKSSSARGLRSAWVKGCPAAHADTAGIAARQTAHSSAAKNRDKRIMAIRYVAADVETGPPRRTASFKGPATSDTWPARLTTSLACNHVRLALVAGDVRAPRLGADHRRRFPHDVELTIAAHFADHH